MVNILVPIAICAILPICIVAIIFSTIMNADNKRAAVLMKALETNNNIDADKLAEALNKPRKTARERLTGRLLRGCIFSLVGIVLLAVGIFNRACGVDIEADPVALPLMSGAISLAVGVSFLIVYFVTRKDLPAHDGEK